MGASALNLRFDDAPPLLLPPGPPVDVADFGALLWSVARLSGV